MTHAQSPYRTGFAGKCPYCGKGDLFKGPLVSGSLALVDRCEVCDFDFSNADPGDGAQVFVIFILGALSALVGVFLYTVFSLPAWAILSILFVFIIVTAIWMLRVIKAILVALQYHHDAHEGQIEDD